MRAAADALRLPYADDPHNESALPQRNQLRHEVLPMLRSRFNPELTAALGRTARLAAADEEALSERALGVPLIPAASGAVKIPAAALVALPPAVASRVARRALRVMRGPHAGSAAEVEAVMRAARGMASTIGGAIQVGREGAWVVLAGEQPAPPAPVAVEIPGETVFWAGVVTATPGRPRWLPTGRSVAVLEGSEPLTLRRPRAGDRISIGVGHKSVGDALAEAGVPPRLRPHWPVVARRGSIAWVVGVRAEPSSGIRTPITVVARLEEM